MALRCGTTLSPRIIFTCLCMPVRIGRPFPDHCSWQRAEPRNCTTSAKAGKVHSGSNRYYATPCTVDTDEHFFRCVAYIDLNIMRAGVVKHPLEWPHCGYREIVDPPRRYRILAKKRLALLLGTPEASLADNYRARLDRHVNQLGRHATKPGQLASEGVKQAFWTDAVAVGSAPKTRQLTMPILMAKWGF